MLRAITAIAAATAGLASSSALAAPAASLISEATTQKQLPCDVLAHGMGAVLSSMTGRPPTDQCDKSVDPVHLELGKLADIIPGEHPAHYYLLASRLFSVGRKDEAVFWFYAGQLRYRARLACHPDLPRDVEPALFGALQSEVGQPINQYAGGNPSKFVASLENALRWDEATPNGFEPKAQCAAAIAKQREGLQRLIDHVRNSADEMRAERAKNGLPNDPK